jgi:hypothetical protein
VTVPQQTRAIRTWLCLAAALVAAAFADPLVEFASNSGLFGPGTFTDHSNLDVLPALTAGFGLGLVYVLMRTRRILALGAGAVLGAAPAWSLLPYAFGTQIALLYAMETAEQLVVAGHVMGGTIWLGGPPLASLAVHAACCLLATFLLARAARSLSQKAARIVGRIVAAIGVAPRSPAVTFLRVSRRPDARRRAPLLGRFGDRAPPQPTA